MRDGVKQGIWVVFGLVTDYEGSESCAASLVMLFRFTRKGKAALRRLVSTESDAAPAWPLGREVASAHKNRFEERGDSAGAEIVHSCMRNASTHSEHVATSRYDAGKTSIELAVMAASGHCAPECGSWPLQQFARARAR